MDANIQPLNRSSIGAPSCFSRTSRKAELSGGASGGFLWHAQAVISRVPKVTGTPIDALNLEIRAVTLSSPCNKTPLPSSASVSEDHDAISTSMVINVQNLKIIRVKCLPWRIFAFFLDKDKFARMQLRLENIYFFYCSEQTFALPVFVFSIQRGNLLPFSD